MKKLLCILIFFVSGCSTDNVSKIRNGVKVIGKCCKELTADKKMRVSAKQGDYKEADNNISPVLPAFFWDTKSMIR